MKNKNLWLKLSLLAFSVLWFSISFSSAVKFNLNVEWIKALSRDAIKENMMNIHFADNWNDFWGFFYFSNGSGEEVEWNYEVGTSDKSNFVCGKQIRWFYYNAERWERLWPLDDQTWQNIPWINGLNTSWWIYTLCGNSWYVAAMEGCKEGNFGSQKNLSYSDCVNEVKNAYPSDGFGYYGQLNQTYSWQEFKLTVGVDYNVPTLNGKFISIKSGSDLKPTFIRINNKYPVGFVYDYNGWVGLAWCRFDENYLTWGSMKNLINKIKNGNEINLLNVFEQEGTWIKYKGTDGAITCTGVISTEDTLVKVLVEWIVWLDNHGTWTKFWSLGNTTDTKMQYFGTKTASNVALMNYAAKKAESLCRWKWDKEPFNKNNKKIYCIEENSNKNIDASLYADGSTLIVKWWASVMVKPVINKIYDIFIDGWDLYIDEWSAEKYVIGTDGFVSDTDDQIGQQAFNIYAFLKEGRDTNDVECCMKDYDNDDVSECPENKDLACDAFDFDGEMWVNLTDLQNTIVNAVAHSYKNLSSMASVIKWNFIVNWKVKGLDKAHNSLAEGESPDIKLKHKYFIYGKFTTKSSLSELENVFSWRCENWFGTDGIFCPKFEWNPYRNAALVVIDQNYGSPLLGA